MFRTIKYSAVIGVASALALAVSAMAGPPQQPIQVPKGPISLGPAVSCPTGFALTASNGSPSAAHYYTCTAKVACPRGPANLNTQTMGVNAAKTGAMTGTLQFTCNYQIIQ